MAGPLDTLTPHFAMPDPVLDYVKSDPETPLFSRVITASASKMTLSQIYLLPQVLDSSRCSKRNLTSVLYCS